MTTPDGMRWIDVTYKTRREGHVGEACMRLLIAGGIAVWLASGELGTDSYSERLQIILNNREALCRGEYVYGSAKVEVVDDEEA